MKREPTVYIVDDDEPVVRSLTDVIELIGLKVKSFSSGSQFLKGYKPSGPACLILDVIMPDMSGLELQKHLAAAGITLPTVIISGHSDVRTAVEAMKLGAIEFLEKPFRIQELCDNIQRAIRLDEEKWRVRELKNKVDRRMENLTPAEREVMDLVVAGKTNKMIAADLDLSIRAVEDRRARMMKKLRVKSRPELLELVMASQFHSSILPQPNAFSLPTETMNPSR
ncbi:MAG: response regulator [Thermoguttaceae bacterium]|jgi:FixJ family two-component response regulator